MSAEEEDSIYKRIGGSETISKLVDSFYEKVLADPELKFYFEHVPMDKLRRMQREFFSTATGGPIVYSGRPLSEVHRGLAISRREFQRFTEHLIETLQEVGIGEQDVYDIIAHVNLYADEITNEPIYGSD
ncbi:MAG: group 1 truncated hemoglobin [Verrucomicrobiales bacterium]